MPKNMKTWPSRDELLEHFAQAWPENPGGAGSSGSSAVVSSGWRPAVARKDGLSVLAHESRTGVWGTHGRGTGFLSSLHPGRCRLNIMTI